MIVLGAGSGVAAGAATGCSGDLPDEPPPNVIASATPPTSTTASAPMMSPQRLRRGSSSYSDMSVTLGESVLRARSARLEPSSSSSNQTCEMFCESVPGARLPRAADEVEIGSPVTGRLRNGSITPATGACVGSSGGGIDATGTG